jgi:hypothetical protein
VQHAQVLTFYSFFFFAFGPESDKINLTKFFFTGLFLRTLLPSASAEPNAKRVKVDGEEQPKPFFAIASSHVSPSASCVLFVEKVQVATLENRVSVSINIPSVAVPLVVLPIISEDGGLLTLQVATSTSNRDEV